VIHSVETATPRAKLVRVAVDDAFTYAAGQAVLVAPRGLRPLRPYSIASAPEDAKRSGLIDLLIGTDSQTDWTFDPAPGDPVDVEGPIGSFTLPSDPPERRFLFIAGGTGIAPLRAMLRHALGIPHDRIALFYSARTPDEFAFESEFRALADAGAIEFRQTVTRGAHEGWTGGRGRITLDSLRDVTAGDGTLCFVCGPVSMVAEVPTLLSGLGIAPDHIKIDEW
jgi:NAD(P)H-flavin reductase